MPGNKLDAAAGRLTVRYRKGPFKREAGKMYASGDDWWLDWWKGSKGKATHEIERDLEIADSPERVSAAKAAHDMRDPDLLNYAKGKGWVGGKGSESSVGDQMLRDVVRKELRHRGYTVAW